MVGFVLNRSQKGDFEHHPITCFYAHKDWNNLFEDSHL